MIERWNMIGETERWRRDAEQRAEGEFRKSEEKADRCEGKEGRERSG